MAHEEKKELETDAGPFQIYHPKKNKPPEVV